MGRPDPIRLPYSSRHQPDRLTESIDDDSRLTHHRRPLSVSLITLYDPA
jgi:hypothetical protein